MGLSVLFCVLVWLWRSVVCLSCPVFPCARCVASPSSRSSGLSVSSAAVAEWGRDLISRPADHNCMTRDAPVGGQCRRPFVTVTSVFLCRPVGYILRADIDPSLPDIFLVIMHSLRADSLRCPCTMQRSADPHRHRHTYLMSPRQARQLERRPLSLPRCSLLLTPPGFRAAVVFD